MTQHVKNPANDIYLRGTYQFKGRASRAYDLGWERIWGRRDPGSAETHGSAETQGVTRDPGDGRPTPQGTSRVRGSGQTPSRTGPRNRGSRRVK